MCGVCSECFDFVLQSWSILPVRWTESWNDKHPGDDVGVSAYQHTLYLVGGGGSSVFAANSNVTAVNLKDYSITSLPPIKQPRDKCSVITTKGMVLVFGGESDGRFID